ncbi:hypothetical protein G5B38_18890 (plasmid) [Pseudohalocynthiibacter aestuariivivens]|jgi:starvation-inducible outer membrane lipoprotein|nr:hypothetical protein G5B38_18890 [Pseudohalocynthiibacter aestuariivivens]
MIKIYVFAGVSALFLSACASEPTTLPGVASQQATIDGTISSPLSYSNPLVGYTYRGPTGPRDWRSVNEEQSEAN